MTPSAVPSSAAVAFPYVLFGLLGLAILALFLELAIEARRTKKVHILIRKQQVLAEERDAFWHLAANYLRAPVTLIVGGAEALHESQTNDATTVISSLAASLQIKVGQIMSKIEGSTSLQAIKVDHEQATPAVKYRAMLVIPLAIVGILTMISDYIVTGYHRLNISPVGYLSQVVIFVTVGVALYWGGELLSQSKTTRKMAEEILKQQTLELANARHDLIEETASSLNPDLTRLEELLKGLSDPMAVAAGGALQTIRQGAERLRDIVVSFGLLIRVQEGTGAVTAAPQTESIDLTTVLNDVRAKLTASATAKGVQIALPAASLPVATEYDMAKQVIGSIVANAVDYSPTNGKVTVEARWMEKAIQLQVIDQGQGINKKQLAHVFQPFVRADGTSAMDMSHGGFGINLYLDKMIMEQMGGSISATSTPGKGTAITMTWPMASN